MGYIDPWLNEVPGKPPSNPSELDTRKEIHIGCACVAPLSGSRAAKPLASLGSTLLGKPQCQPTIRSLWEEKGALGRDRSQTCEARAGSPAVDQAAVWDKEIAVEENCLLNVFFSLVVNATVAA